jgi:ABC-2 type transport system permease protein
MPLKEILKMSVTTGNYAQPLAPVSHSGIANTLRDTYTLYRRSLIKLTRNPAALFFSLIQPLIWFLLFGQVFSRLTTGFGAAPVGANGQNPVTAQFGTDNYAAFFLPSIIIQMMLFGAAGSALNIISDDQSGYLNKLRVAPINRTAILLGNILADLTRMAVQVAVLLVVGVLFGVRMSHWELIPLIFLVTAAFSLMMGGIGIYIGLTTRNTQVTFLIINFFTLPLLFTSSAQLPTTLLPDWLQTVSRLNPVSYGIEAIRVIVTGLNATQIAEGQTVFSVIFSGLGVLTVLAVAAMALATWRFRKQIK